MRLRSLVPGIAALAVLFAAVPSPAPAQVSIGIGVSVGFAPPAIPVYVQPPCPQPNYIWTPGYWAYGDAGYYWVPGTWVAAPQPGYLWTPGYWGYNNGSYAFVAGYWGTQVGFYGGINYGAGYYGNGYVGGAWSGRNFRYNTAVTNVNRSVIRNVYENRAVAVNRNASRVSYNGGPGGLRVRPTVAQTRIDGAHHVGMLAAQRENQQYAAQNRAYLAKVNNGRPQVAAVQRPLSATNRPASFEAIRASDRTHAGAVSAGRNASAEKAAANSKATQQREAASRAQAEKRQQQAAATREHQAAAARRQQAAAATRQRQAVAARQQQAAAARQQQAAAARRQQASVARQQQRSAVMRQQAARPQMQRQQVRQAPQRPAAPPQRPAPAPHGGGEHHG